MGCRTKRLEGKRLSRERVREEYYEGNVRKELLRKEEVSWESIGREVGQNRRVEDVKESKKNNDGTLAEREVQPITLLAEEETKTRKE